MLFLTAPRSPPLAFAESSLIPMAQLAILLSATITIMNVVCYPMAKDIMSTWKLPHEKYAIMPLDNHVSEAYFMDCVQMLSERRLHDGDALASQWFMEKIK